MIDEGVIVIPWQGINEQPKRLDNGQKQARSRLMIPSWVRANDVLKQYHIYYPKHYLETTFGAELLEHAQP